MPTLGFVLMVVAFTLVIEHGLVPIILPGLTKKFHELDAYLRDRYDELVDKVKDFIGGLKDKWNDLWK